MRGTTPDLGTPYPLAGLLPAALQEDDLTIRLTAGLDTVLAPVIATLDCLHAYVDPRLAPADFVTWLASWVGVTLDENWPVHRQRAAVRHAVELYRLRGTVAGLRAHLAVVTGGTVEVLDGGGVFVASTPDGPYPDRGEQEVLVRITGPDEGTHDLASLDALVAAAKPAHVPHRVEIVA